MNLFVACTFRFTKSWSLMTNEFTKCLWFSIASTFVADFLASLFSSKTDWFAFPDMFENRTFADFLGR